MLKHLPIIKVVQGHTFTPAMGEFSEFGRPNELEESNVRGRILCYAIFQQPSGPLSMVYAGSGLHNVIR